MLTQYVRDTRKQDVLFCKLHTKYLYDGNIFQYSNFDYRKQNLITLLCTIALGYVLSFISMNGFVIGAK